jgi:hypothetical protein
MEFVLFARDHSEYAAARAPQIIDLSIIAGDP